MSEIRPEEVGNPPAIVEVRVFRDGDLVTRARCESEEEAAALVAAWEEYEHVTCEVVDFAAALSEASAFEVAPVDAGDAYPTVFEAGQD
jgi:hypothetical protein